MNHFITELIILAPPLLFALTFHEFAHGFVAYRLGDPTARDAGRLTLNPLKHLDPLGTIAFFFIKFGWAKPVPVNPNYFKNPKKDMLWVALAGSGNQPGGRDSQRDIDQRRLDAGQHPPLLSSGRSHPRAAQFDADSQCLDQPGPVYFQFSAHSTSRRQPHPHGSAARQSGPVVYAGRAFRLYSLFLSWPSAVCYPR